MRWFASATAWLEAAEFDVSDAAWADIPPSANTAPATPANQVDFRYM
jgi:hypothetical protein